MRKAIAASITTDPTEAFSLELAAGTTVQEMMEILAIKDSETIIALVNGLRQPHDFVLQDGDRVGLFPPVGGG